MIFHGTGLWDDGLPALRQHLPLLPELVLQFGLGHRFQTMTNNQDVAIFIVDDDPDVRRALKRLLTIVKFRVGAPFTAGISKLRAFLEFGGAADP